MAFRLRVPRGRQCLKISERTARKHAVSDLRALLELLGEPAEYARLRRRPERRHFVVQHVVLRCSHDHGGNDRHGAGIDFILPR